MISLWIHTGQRQNNGLLKPLLVVDGHTLQWDLLGSPRSQSSAAKHDNPHAPAVSDTHQYRPIGLRPPGGSWNYPKNRCFNHVEPNGWLLTTPPKKNYWTTVVSCDAKPKVLNSPNEVVLKYGAQKSSVYHHYHQYHHFPEPTTNFWPPRLHCRKDGWTRRSTSNVRRGGVLCLIKSMYVRVHICTHIFVYMHL